MKANLLLDDLIGKVLQEIWKFGLCTEGYRQYRRAYSRIKEFATKRNIDTFCEELFLSYLKDIKKRHKEGTIGQKRQRYLMRTLFLLRDCAANGAVEWKVYKTNHQSYPVSREFMLLHSRFIDHLRFLGRSKNTIESGRNSVRQFLLFLEDNGCCTLGTATVDMVPLFFRHLLATYSSTSIRTVASNIRSFLRFVGNEELLRAVPSRCARKKPIIPILSETESNALHHLLKSRKVSFRDKAIILLAWQTGLRACDIVQLRMKDIDWINDTISIIQSKTGRSLSIPLIATFGNVLSAYILNERPKVNESCVFLRSQAPHKPLSDHSACYGLIRRAFALAGIRIGNERKGTHVMRHSAASRMLSNGVPITTISSMLGHSSKSSTDVYLSTDTASLRKCALSLAGIPMNCGGLT